MARVVIIGAGAMGLAAAYHAAKAGHAVEVLEAGAEAGGMAAHFDFDGLSIERFYHFVCKTDQPTFKLLAELGLAEKMRWRSTSMGYFSGGKLHRWVIRYRCCSTPASAFSPASAMACWPSSRPGAIGGTRWKRRAHANGSPAGLAARCMKSCGSGCSTSSSMNMPTMYRQHGSGPG